MKDMVVIEGQDYKWLYDFLFRMVTEEETPTNDDYNRIHGLVERASCCDRCEANWNMRALENAGYENKGGV